MNQTKYKHIFFDLDHTLWDHERNASETLYEVYDHFALTTYGIKSPEAFCKTFSKVNSGYWRKYRKNKTTKEILRLGRFEDTMNRFGVYNKQLAMDVSAHYMKACPQKSHVFPYTHEVLDYLKEKYVLHIITNGFKEVQEIKLSKSNLNGYFDKIIISEEVGYLKPHRKIFDHSVQLANSIHEESIMIGDNLDADIIGAKKSGMDQVYFNPNKNKHIEKVTFEISCLSELRGFL